MAYPDCPHCKASGGTCWPEHEGESNCVCCLQSMVRALVLAFGRGAPMAIPQTAFDMAPDFEVSIWRRNMRHPINGEPCLIVGARPIGELAEAVQNDGGRGGALPMKHKRDTIGRDALKAFLDALEDPRKPE